MTASMSRQSAVRRASTIRGVIAIVLAVATILGVLVTLDVWKESVAPAMISLPSNVLLTIGLIVAGVRAFAVSRRGGQVERSAAADRMIAFIGLLVVFGMVFSALSAAGAPEWIGVLVYAVVMSVALETILILNWKSASVEGPLAAQRPLGTRQH